MDFVFLVQHAALLVFMIAMVGAGASDVLSFTIPNFIPVVLIAVFALLAPLAGMDGMTSAQHILAGATIFVACFVMFALGWIGGGDAKLAAAAALWIGWDGLLPFVAMTAISGGVLTIGLLAIRRVALPDVAMRQAWLARLRHPATGVPYGIAIAAGAIAVYPQTVWFGLALG